MSSSWFSHGILSGQHLNWLSEIAGEAASVDHQSLRQNVKIAVLHRGKEKPDEAGRQPWYNILYVYDMDSVLVEEVLSYPLNEDLSSRVAIQK